ncbi:transcriptional activator protein acu-15 [Rhypophila decipiens]
MATNWEDDFTEASSGGPSEQSTSIEALACVTCRARKLKCDRRVPGCSRCEKSNNNCVYPETRRKPAFKRRNVKDLEQRLAQVEGALKNASFRGTRRAESITSGSNASGQSPESTFTVPDKHGSVSQVPDEDNVNSPEPGELMGLGRFEALPPDQMIEELHDIFFESGHPILPLRGMIHKNRYIQAFYSAPHKRPPMCLQYAIWTMGASNHEKYRRYHPVFYRRARQYLETDELKAWALLAIYEAGCMQFSRVAISSAKCVRLVHVMGLHRLDEPGDQDGKASLPQTLPPPQSWVELEERRRVFWCAFCIDGHSSISTGWPSLMNLDEITTHLPVPEEAFETEKPEKSFPLQDVFNGAQYPTLAGVVINCHIFKVLLSHINRPWPDDRPQDVDSGPFWQRHRDLDNMLSNTFMFLPEQFRLPKNLLNPIAVRTTLNLHGSTICLHNTAWSVADRYNLPDALKNISKTRSLAAAQEIVGVIKLLRAAGDFVKRPLTIPSLYCAAAAFIHQGMENPDDFPVSNLEVIVECIEIVSRQDVMARAYLNQLVLDIVQSGLSAYIKIPLPPSQSPGTHIPLLARGTLFRHNQLQRLPFSARTGNTMETLAAWDNNMDFSVDFENDDGASAAGSSRSGHNSKRKRVEPTVASSQPLFSFTLADNWFGQCGPLHFDPMTLPGQSEPVTVAADSSRYQAALPDRSTVASSSQQSGSFLSPQRAAGQASPSEDLLMAFGALDESTSTSPVLTSPMSYGDVNDLFGSAADVHGYNSFVNSDNSTQLPNMGMGVGGDLFPGLDVWGQIHDGGSQQQQQQQQLFGSQEGDPWADLQQAMDPEPSERQRRGGDNWGSGG